MREVYVNGVKYLPSLHIVSGWGGGGRECGTVFIAKLEKLVYGCIAN
jgi:hypothetical protein